MSYYEKRYSNEDGSLREGNIFKDVIKWGFALLFISAVIGGCGVYTGLFAQWFATPAKIFSPDNVKKQWDFAYTYDESLQATARNVCIAEQAVKSATTDTERVARNSQLFSLQTNYSRIEGEYNAALRNAFEAKLVRPSDVPERAPTLIQARVKVGC